MAERSSNRWHSHELAAGRALASTTRALATTQRPAFEFDGMPGVVFTFGSLMIAVFDRGGFGVGIAERNGAVSGWR